MGIFKGSEDLITNLKQGIDELSSLETDDHILNHALNLILSLSGYPEGFLIKKTGEDTWDIKGDKNIHIPSSVTDRLSQEGDTSLISELKELIPEELKGIGKWAVPINVDNKLTAVLILGGGNEPEIFQLQKECIEFISGYVSLLLSNYYNRLQMQEMKSHYEDLIIKTEIAERLASLGTIAAGLAHEIKNPLVSIKTLAELLPERFEDPEFRTYFTNIAITEIDRIECIVSDLLDFAKSSEPRFEPLDLNRFLDSIILMLSSQLTKRRIIVLKRLPEDLPIIYADHSQIKQVLLNLFINSMEAMPDGGEITVEVIRDDGVPDDEKVIIRIKDTGYGIKDDDKIHLFKPFFTTKGSGTGLGLSICKRIIEKHNGEIEIESDYNNGTAVSFKLHVRKQ